MNTLPINTPCQYKFLSYPTNSSYQLILSVHHINPPYLHTLFTLLIITTCPVLTTRPQMTSLEQELADKALALSLAKKVRSAAFQVRHTLSRLHI